MRRRRKDWPWLSPTLPGWTWSGDWLSSAFRTAVVHDDEGRRITPDRGVLAALDSSVRLYGRLSLEIDYLVAEARACGFTWEDIASAIGCTRQSAHQKYHKRLAGTVVPDVLQDDVESALARASQVIHDPNATAAELREAHQVDAIFDDETN